MSTKNFENFKDSRDYIQSLHRGLQVIQAFSKENPTLSVSEIAKITELSRPTVRRLLLTLEYLGFVTSNHNAYTLSPKILSLGNAYLASQNSVWEAAIPYMQKFADETGESTSISVLDGRNIIYVARVSKKRIMSINIEVGTQLPAVATSMGHVLLAHLPKEKLYSLLETIEFKKYTDNTILDKKELIKVLESVLSEGWAGVDQQFELGLRSIAVPIYNQSGEVMAAINCSAHAGRILKQQLREEFLPLLKETAHQIGQSVYIRPTY